MTEYDFLYSYSRKYHDSTVNIIFIYNEENNIIQTIHVDFSNGLSHVIHVQFCLIILRIAHYEDVAMRSIDYS